MPVPFVRAIQPPKPNGVGVATPATVTLMSLRGMLTFSTPSLKSPVRARTSSTPWYSAGIPWAAAAAPVNHPIAITSAPVDIALLLMAGSVPVTEGEMLR